MLDIWQELPIIISGHHQHRWYQDYNYRKAVDNVISILGLNDRVCSIRLSDLEASSSVPENCGSNGGSIPGVDRFNTLVVR